jgi:hypothetical protein
MADETPGSPPPSGPPPASGAAGAKPAPGPTINIADEFGTAKRNLPPAKVVVLAVVGVLIVVAIASFLKRAKPQASGSLDNVVAVAVPGQNTTMVALTFTVRNTSDKILYVHSIQGKIKTVSEEASAEAVSAVDFDRYFQAFPALKNGAQPPLVPETKLQPGEVVTRTVMVGIPVTLDAFNQRQSVTVVIWPYDQQVPVELRK